MYKLMNEKNKEYLSEEKGLYGGHKKLKIYGLLDCKSALNYLQKGYYKKERVFFKDEKTALNAGYRPCAKCLPELYKEWKKTV